MPFLDLVKNAEAVVALFGQLDFHDADLCGVRLSVARGNVPTLDLDLTLPGASALAGAAADAGRDYCITLRCIDVTALSLADFDGANRVASYEAAPSGADGDGHPTFRVAITCAPGCDLEFHCREIVMAAVAPLG